MGNALTFQQMKALEEDVIGSGRVAGLVLMERAGQGIVDAVIEHWPELPIAGAKPSRNMREQIQNRASLETQKKPVEQQAGRENRRSALVLCGPGNNGGDGFVVARLLFEMGWEITVYFYGDPAALSSDAKTNLERWCALSRSEPARLSFPGVTIPEAEHVAAHLTTDHHVDLVVDALFGIGLARPIDGLRPIVERINAAHRAQGNAARPLRVVSVDVPSGIAEHGPLSAEDHAALCADLTVTFHALKTSHIEAPDHCGRVVVVDIGL